MPSSLKWLELGVENEVGACLEIDAPALKYLSLRHITFRTAVGKFHKVEEACLCLFSPPESESVDPLLNLFRALSCIKHLEFHSSTTQWLYAAPVLDFPEFCYLLYLELWFRSFNLGFLFDILQKCPTLQTLITYNDNDKFQSYVTDDSSPSYGWAVKPISVPNCLVSHLTSIQYFTFYGNVHELEFIGYVLQNGLALKTMFIDIDSSVDPSEGWEKKISDLPRGSAMCQLEFE